MTTSALEFVAYSLGFFHDGHRAASDCRATLHALAQPLYGAARIPSAPGKSGVADMAVMGEGQSTLRKRIPQGPRLRLEPRRVRATKMLVSRRVGGREVRRAILAPPKRDGADQAVWALCITARDRCSDRCWGWGERVAGQAVRDFDTTYIHRPAFEDTLPISAVRDN
jgi:hypothetical protein